MCWRNEKNLGSSSLSISTSLSLFFKMSFICMVTDLIALTVRFSWGFYCFYNPIRKPLGLSVNVLLTDVFASQGPVGGPVPGVSGAGVAATGAGVVSSAQTSSSIMTSQVQHKQHKNSCLIRNALISSIHPIPEKKTWRGHSMAI